MELKLTVTGQNFRIVSGSSQLVSDTINYVSAVCSFSDEWIGLDKWLHLRSPAGQIYDIALDETDGVKHLNLSAAGLWELWIHGHKPEPELRITTTSDTIRVIQSGILNGAPLPELSLTAQEQIASDAAYAKAEVEALRQEMTQLDQTVIDVEENSKLAIEAKNSAEQCLNKLPYPDPGTKTWWRWNSSTNTYEDTSERAQGVQGPKGEQGTPGEDLLAPGSLPLNIGHDSRGYYCITGDSAPKSYLATLGTDGVPSGAAPAGFGLGGTAKLVTDPDVAVKCGFYAVDGSAVNVPFGYGTLIVTNFSNDYYPFQILSAAHDNSQCIRGGGYVEGAIKWKPWEWVNPPMQLGVEYRTTERYQGKPVYTKLVDCGVWANGKQVEYISKSALQSVISLSVQINGKATYPYNDSQMYAYISFDHIVIQGREDTWGGNVMATVKYTKVGD